MPPAIPPLAAALRPEAGEGEGSEVEDEVEEACVVVGVGPGLAVPELAVHILLHQRSHASQ